MKKPLFWCIFLSLAPTINYAQSSYNLPQTMIRLCNFSYITDTTSSKQVVKDSVQTLGMKVVWGPVELIDDFGVSYSSMYVANDLTGNYTVVIRGTNYESLKSWIGEDFQVHKAVKFSRFVKPAPSDAKISKGTCNGMDDLIKLKDKNNSGHVVSFLLQAKSMIKGFYVTGHSLGGTLTPPFYAYLCYKIFGGQPPLNINSSPFSFAGLTAGNKGFNDLLQTYIQTGDTNWRYVNPLDVAPNLWDGGDAIKTMYTPYGLPYAAPESDLIDYLIYRAKPNNYVQPDSSKLTLDTVFNTAKNSWISQAEYQHHSTTYISLVDKCYAKRNDQ